MVDLMLKNVKQFHGSRSFNIFKWILREMREVWGKNGLHFSEDIAIFSFYFFLVCTVILFSDFKNSKKGQSNPRNQTLCL